MEDDLADRLPLAEWLERVRALRERLRQKYGVLSAGTIDEEIRAARCERTRRILGEGGATDDDTN